MGLETHGTWPLMRFLPKPGGRRGCAAWQRWPRSRIAQVGVVLVAGVDVVWEEIVFRGIFVVMLHAATGSFLLAVCFGLLADLGFHAYYGPRWIPFHALHYALSVALTYSPFGLVAAIGLHLANNMAVMLVEWLQARRRMPGTRSGAAGRSRR